MKEIRCFVVLHYSLVRVTLFAMTPAIFISEIYFHFVQLIGLGFMCMFQHTIYEQTQFQSSTSVTSVYLCHLLCRFGCSLNSSNVMNVSSSLGDHLKWYIPATCVTIYN